MPMKSFILSLCLLLLLSNPLSLTAAHPSSAVAEKRAWVHSMRERVGDMTRQDRSELKRSIRSEVKAFKQKKRAGEEADVSTLLLTLIALILPPLAVYLHQGEINSKFWISLLLTLLIWVPGVVYALLVIFGVVA